MIPEQHHHHHHHHPAYAQGPYKPPPPPPSPPSSPAPGKPCCGLRFCCSKPRRRCCCHCGASVNSSAFTCFGVCVLVLGYTLLGAFTFTALEGGRSGAGPSPGSVVLGEEVRARTVDKLWSITEDLNILYKDNWTRLAAQEVLKFQDTLVRNLRGGALHYPHHHHRWSFSSSFLYSLTLITTIGYGSVAPRTPWGKVITIVYALIGIPLMLVYLSTVGDVLARNFRRLYGRICGGGSGANCSKSSAKSSKEQQYLATGYTTVTKAHNNIAAADGKVHHFHPEPGDVLDCGGDGIGASSSTPLDPGGKMLRHHHLEPVRVPISLCLLIILMYICGGALLFNRLENWSFLEGSYFCFTSLGTIGFGDLMPGLLHYEQLSVFASSAYILVGMALIAMCFNLVQDEVVILVRRLGHYFGASGAGGREGGEGLGVGVDAEGLAMAVVSSSAATS